jgi:hypothetical protein
MHIEPEKYQLNTKTVDEQTHVRDVVREKYVKLTPEEWVRQLVINFLMEDRNVPRSLMAVEMDLEVNDQKKRCDLAVYNRQGTPVVVVECKAPDVDIDQETFNQVARYNLALQVKYLVVSNGRTNYCCRLDYSRNTYQFIDTLPPFDEM